MKSSTLLILVLTSAGLVPLSCRKAPQRRSALYLPTCHGSALAGLDADIAFVAHSAGLYDKVDSSRVVATQAKGVLVRVCSPKASATGRFLVRNRTGRRGWIDEKALIMHQHRKNLSTLMMARAKEAFLRRNLGGGTGVVWLWWGVLMKNSHSVDFEKRAEKTLIACTRRGCRRHPEVHDQYLRCSLDKSERSRRSGARPFVVLQCSTPVEGGSSNSVRVVRLTAEGPVTGLVQKTLAYYMYQGYEVMAKVDTAKDGIVVDSVSFRKARATRYGTHGKKIVQTLRRQIKRYRFSPVKRRYVQYSTRGKPVRAVCTGRPLRAIPRKYRSGRTKGPLGKPFGCVVEAVRHDSHGAAERYRGRSGRWLYVRAAGGLRGWIFTSQVQFKDRSLCDHLKH